MLKKHKKILENILGGNCPNVETDVNVRWEEGIDHYEKSEAIYSILADLDFKLGGDYFCFKKGGDGDNGEILMYLLDVYFEAEDKFDENEF